MIENKYIEEIRELKVEKEELKKHWSGYNANEVEDYINKLKKQMHKTEIVFQERYEDQRTSLIAMTRERDELMEKLKNAVDPIKNNASNEEESLKAKMVEMSSDMIDQLKEANGLQSKKVEQLELSLEQMKEGYQKLLKQNQKIQKANQKVLSDRKLSESEADVLSKNWKAERASIIQHYQRIQHNQQIALEKLQEIIESSDQRMENLNEFEVKDFLYEIDDEENEISNFKIEL